MRKDVIQTVAVLLDDAAAVSAVDDVDDLIDILDKLRKAAAYRRQAIKERLEGKIQEALRHESAANGEFFRLYRDL